MRGKQAEKPTSHPSSHYLWPVILVRDTGGVEPSWHQASGRSHSRHVARSKSSSPAHRLLSRPIRTTHLKNLAVSTCETKRRLQPSVSVTDLWRWWWLKAPETEKVQRLYSRLKKIHGPSCFCHRDDWYVLPVSTNDCSAQSTLRDPNLSNHPVRQANKYLPARQK